MANFNFDKFMGKLPYDSELFGIYQPLIGWKSRLTKKRIILHPINTSRLPKEAVIKDNDIVLKGKRLAALGGGEVKFYEGANTDLFLKNPASVQFEVPDFLNNSLMLGYIQSDLRSQLDAHQPNERDFWNNYWKQALGKEALNNLFKDKLLEDVSKRLWNGVANLTAIPAPSFIDEYFMHVLTMFPFVNSDGKLLPDAKSATEYILNREIYVGQYLNDLVQGPNAENLSTVVNPLLLKVSPGQNLQQTIKQLDLGYLAAALGRDAVLSPIGIIHLFRQYFFEFDTFLGPAAEHLWLSPGSTIELIEISTRRVLQERSLEQILETVDHSESTITTQDELAQAIRDENQQNSKYGASLSGGANILIAHVDANASMSMEETQKKAREENHRISRQQSEKLSSEIRQNFKSTFRTVTEVTDTRSKRYVIANNSERLINYELRRKMRQVGVQLQDMGTQLCWQVYVDDPGAELGIAQLVHLAAKSDLSQFVHLPEQPVPGKITQTAVLLLPVPNPGQRSDKGPIAAGVLGFAVGGVPGIVVAVSAYEVLDSLFSSGDKSNGYTATAPNNIKQTFKIPLPEGYMLAQNQEEDDTIKKKHDNVEGDVPVDWLLTNGQHLVYKLDIESHTDGTVILEVDNGGVTPGELIEFRTRITLVPTDSKLAAVTAANQAIKDENQKRDIQLERQIKQDFVNAVKDRVKLASKVKPRKLGDLREEERTVIYRNLVGKLMQDVWNVSVDRQVAHLRSEMIKSIFDVDKMLYFVAPEWWQPRLHSSGLDLNIKQSNFEARTPINAQSTSSPLVINDASRAALNRVASMRYSQRKLPLNYEDIVGWGGEDREDNYLITEDSDPARLGSSLGWLLQLDGDNLRNAFLNAPWVKAVIPIKPGRENDAINWLTQSEVEGTDGLDQKYAGDDLDYFKEKNGGNDPTIREVISILADDVSQKHSDAVKTIKEDNAEVAPGTKKTVFYVPPDSVFEKGLDPLKDGFRANPQTPFEVFDQWVEILPTDQIVAVEVEYDPKTGLLKDK